MKKTWMPAAALVLFAQVVWAQNTFTARIQDSKSKEPVPGAVVTVAGTTIGSAADERGIAVLQDVPAGKQLFRITAMGYEPRADSIIPAADTMTIYLAAEELDEVVVQTTRSGRTIRDIPTRIEFLSGEELEEKGNMKPGDIRMMLSESTGIQTLQTSATTGNSSIRIEGMDGRYTQILKDGFPLYSGFAGGLGLPQTPPLDLKQVEIIKGASSTLYGGGAIAGLVNLISKTPSKEREVLLLANGTSAGGLDLNSFYSERYGKTGVTLYAARNSNAPYDPSGTGLSAIPKFERYTVNPRLFIYVNDKVDVMIGISTMTEKRIGGDMQYLKGNGDSIHGYYEDNNSLRLSAQSELKYRISDKSRLSLKVSADKFARRINMPGYTFDGTQTSTFSELSYSRSVAGFEVVGGINFLTAAFSEKQLAAISLRNYEQTTEGAFMQATKDLGKKAILEGGLRMDNVNGYGAAVLPRISLLYKHDAHITSRLGGGMGYKPPTLFTEESERIQYRGLLPLRSDLQLERSYGANWDVNYRTTFADNRVTFSVNQLLFYTQLDNPEILTNFLWLYEFSNTTGHIDAQGAETNVKIGYGSFKLFLGYTYTHTHLHSVSAIDEAVLTPRHHTNTVLMYEQEGKWKVGAEAYYYSRQRLGGIAWGRDYWLCGLMAEKIWKHVSLFINFENMLDSRQTRFGPIYTGSITNPVFTDIYAPLDGFVVNGGVKVRW